MASTPRHGPDISPRYTGSSGLPETNALQTSVPPLPIDEQQIGAELLVDPVVPLGRQRRAGDRRRRRCSTGRSRGRAASPALRQAIRNAGLMPSSVARASAAIRHCCTRSGKTGLPSTITMELRRSSAETRSFHIIHAVVVNHSSSAAGPEVPAEARGS